MDAFGFSDMLPEIQHYNLQHSDIVLDGTNYIPWKLTVKRIIDGTRILHHVDGTGTAPTAPSLLDSTTSPTNSFVLLLAFEQ